MRILSNLSKITHVRLLSALVVSTVLYIGQAMSAQTVELPKATISDARTVEGFDITFVVKLDKPAPGPGISTFQYTTRGVTATPGLDYVDRPYRVSFHPGKQETKVHIATFTDDLVEGTETFEFVASEPQGLVLVNTVATGTIRDPYDDTPIDEPEISILAPEQEHLEGETITFHLESSVRPKKSFSVIVDVQKTGNVATQVGELGRRMVSINTNGSGYFQVTTLRDGKLGTSGTIVASVEKGKGYIPNRNAELQRSTVFIVDDDFPVLTVSAPHSITEGKIANFNLLVRPRPASPLTVSLTVSATEDYVSASELGKRTTTIGVDGSTTVRIPTVMDEVDEDDGVITLTLHEGEGYKLTSSHSASVRVTDGDVAKPIVSITAVDTSIDEGATATFALSMLPAPQLNTDVTVNITQTVDYAIASQLGTRTATVGTDGQATLSVATTDDGLPEQTGEIVATVVTGSNYSIGDSATAAVTVIDSSPVVNIRGSDQVIEGEEAYFTVFTAATNFTTLEVVVRISQTGEFLDSSPSTQTVRLTAGGETTIAVASVNDEIDEPNGSLHAQIVPGSTYHVGHQSRTSVLVLDNDVTPGEVTVSIADAEIAEGARNGPRRRTILEFVVSLSQVTSNDVSVYVEERKLTGRLAKRSEDWEFARTNDSLPRLTIEAGKASAVLEVNVIDDTEEESRETFELVITRAVGADVADGTAIGVILPDPLDTPRRIPTITITHGPVVDEGEVATFELIATPAPAEALTVEIEVFDSTNEDSDFLAADAEGKREVTIPGTPNDVFRVVKERRLTVSVPTVDDEVDEPPGIIKVEIVEHPSNYIASVRPWYAEVDIRDNDDVATTPHVLSVADARANESDGKIQFVVSINPPLPDDEGPVTVRYRIFSWPKSLGGATRGVDFERKFGTLIFRPGEITRTVDVVIKQDSHDEGEEYFNFYIYGVKGPATIGDSTAKGTIVNTDPQPKAWLTRFGRMVTEQTLDTVSDRINLSRTQATRNLDTDVSRSSTNLRGITEHRSALELNPFAKSDRTQGFVSDPRRLALSNTRTLPFGNLSTWVSHAETSFYDNVESLDLNGGVSTTHLGLDYLQGNWLVGLALAHSSGRGSYADSSELSGLLTSSLTSKVPFIAWHINDKWTVWGAIGYGDGDVNLVTAYDEQLTGKIEWSMQATGFRSQLLGDATKSGLQLDLVSDLYQTQTQMAATTGLVGVDGLASRARLGLESQWNMTHADFQLQPKFDLHLRQDAGDDIEGSGTEITGGIKLGHTRLGFSLDLEVRKLISHSVRSFEQNAYAIALQYDPTPASHLGLRIKLQQEGGNYQEALNISEPLMREPSPANSMNIPRWTLTTAWGMPSQWNRVIFAPLIELRESHANSVYRVGISLLPSQSQMPMSVKLLSTHEKQSQTIDNGGALELSMHW